MQSRVLLVFLLGLVLPSAFGQIMDFEEMSPNGVAIEYLRDEAAGPAVALWGQDGKEWVEMQLLKLQEIDKNGSVVAAVQGFRNLDWRWVEQSNGTLGKDAFEADLEISSLNVTPFRNFTPYAVEFRLETYFMENNRTIEFANNSVDVYPGQMKWAMNVSGWKFQSSENKLRFGVQLRSWSDFLGSEPPKPNMTSTTTTPSPKSTTTKPLVNTTTSAPLANSTTTTSPLISSTTTSPLLNSTTTSPLLNSTTTSPLLNITTTSPLLNITTTSPLLNITTTSPLLNITTTSEPLSNSTTTTSAPLSNSTTTSPLNITTVGPIVNITTTSPMLNITTSSPLFNTTTMPVLNSTTTQRFTTTGAPSSSPFVLVRNIPGKDNIVALIFAEFTANVISSTKAMADGKVVDVANISVTAFPGLLEMDWDFPAFNSSLQYDPVMAMSDLIVIPGGNSTNITTIMPTQPQGNSTTPGPISSDAGDSSKVVSIAGALMALLAVFAVNRGF